MIRYFRSKDQKSLYATGEGGGFIIRDGLIVSSVQYAREIETSPHHYVEIFAPSFLSPDAGPIEERYIKATDRPSVDGFKHPELGVW